MSNRIYNKLYVNTNREEGSEKILLGYQHDRKEIRLKKDEETYFHIPYYTKPLALKDTSLILDGATGGPFPAASDKIFKSQKNHGNTTHHGNPYYNTADGLWFCSWLFKDEFGNLFWLDRLYNPGNFVFSGAERTLLTSGPIYKKNNPIFRDVPSRLVLEPGVLYKYHHIGEKTAENLVQTFSGEAQDKILLNLSNWGEDKVNIHSAEIQPKINTRESRNLLYEFSSFSERPDKKTINLNSNKPIEIILDYNSAYNPTNEFTAMCWMNSPDWDELPTTQLFGNHSSKGGYGLYVQNLSSYQYFVIPETFYGHILYINEHINGYLDKSIQTTPKISVKPSFTMMDFDQNVIVCNEDRTGTIYKFDNAGSLLASTKTIDVPFNYIGTDEVPLQLLVGHNNTIIVRTNSFIYIFDEHLNKIDQEILTSKSEDCLAFKYNVTENSFELNLTENAKDVKFIETTKWFISQNGNLYKQNEGDGVELYYEFADEAHAFSIDIENRLWVLHGNNRLSIFDSMLAPLTRPRKTVDVGFNVPHEKANISFICTHDRLTNKFEWKCIVFYSDERYIYTLNLDGELAKVLDTASLFDSTLIRTLDQRNDRFKFLSKCDFTGYEHRRVFKQLHPYNNKSQLVFKASLRDTTRQQLTYNQFISRTSILDWPKNSWQHFTIILKNKTFSSFVNSKLATEISFTGRHNLSYELQPLYFIGTSGGSSIGFNQEVQNLSQMHNGLIGDLKIYNYALKPSLLETYLFSFINANDIYWNMPVPLIQYIEKIERMFKNKVPGSKSPLYKIKIRGTKITDPKTKEIINIHLQNSLNKMHPGYTDFLEIEWID